MLDTLKDRPVNIGQLVLDRAAPKSRLPFNVQKDIPQWRYERFVTGILHQFEQLGDRESFCPFLTDMSNFRILYPQEGQVLIGNLETSVRIASVLPSHFIPQNEDHFFDKQFRSLYLLKFATAFPKQFNSLAQVVPEWHEKNWQELTELEEQSRGNVSYTQILATKSLFFRDQFTNGQYNLPPYWAEVAKDYLGKPEGLAIQKNLKLTYPFDTPVGMNQAELFDLISEEIKIWDLENDSVPNSTLLERAAICKILLSENIKFTEEGLSMQTISIPTFDTATPELPGRRRF